MLCDIRVADVLIDETGSPVCVLVMGFMNFDCVKRDTEVTQAKEHQAATQVKEHQAVIRAKQHQAAIRGKQHQAAIRVKLQVATAIQVATRDTNHHSKVLVAPQAATVLRHQRQAWLQMSSACSMPSIPIVRAKSRPKSCKRHCRMAKDRDSLTNAVS